MDNNIEAFYRGAVKRAAELGMQKEAFLPALALELGSSMGGYAAARAAAGALARRAGYSGLMGRIGTGAQKLLSTAASTATSPVKAMAADQAMFMAGSPVANKIKRVFSKPEPPPNFNPR
jgi:hypothetical protein